MGRAWSDSGREERSAGAREESQRLSEGPRWRDSGGEGEPGGRRGWSDRGLGRTRGDWRLRLSPEQGGSPGGSRERTRQVAARELGALRCPQRSQPRRVPLVRVPRSPKSTCPAPIAAQSAGCAEDPQPAPNTPGAHLTRCRARGSSPQRPDSAHHAGNFCRRCRRRSRSGRGSFPSSRSAAAAGIFLTLPLQLPLVTADCEPST